jgi:hypothetical protein
MAESRFRKFDQQQPSDAEANTSGGQRSGRPALPSGASGDAGAVERVRGGMVPARSGLTEERKQAYAQKSQGATVPRFRRLTTVNVDFLFDATGSMGAFIHEAKRSVEQIVTHVEHEIQAIVRFRFVAFRDYDDGADILRASERSEDPASLRDWLGEVRPFGGGDTPEAIEYALLEVLGQNPRPDVVLLAGDAPGHTREELRTAAQRAGIAVEVARRTAVEVAGDFRAANIPIHTFVVGRDATTTQHFQEIAQMSGGASGRLDGSDAMLQMATLAILHKVGGAAAVMGPELDKRLALTPGARDFRQALLGPGRQQ